MDAGTSRAYRFGPFTVDPDQQILLRDGQPVPLPPKAFDLLLALVEQHGRVVLKKDLLERVWPETFVEEANLSVNVSTLRKVLGDGIIETIPKRGYRVATLVRVVGLAPAGALVDPVLRMGAPPETIADPAIPRARSWLRWAISGVGLVVLVAATAWRVRPLDRPYSLATAPFENPTGNPAAGELAQHLQRTVASRLAAMFGTRVELTPLPAGRAPSAAAARDAGANSVISGRIAQREDEWLVQLELTRARDGALLWSDEYGVTLTGVYAVEDRIVAEIARHLPVALTPADRLALQPHSSSSPEAQQFSDRADVLLYKATPDSLRRSIEYAQRAIAIDPAFGMPYGQIAMAYTLLGVTDVLPPAEAVRLSNEWQQRAVRVDESLYTSHITRLDTKLRGWDWSGPRRAGTLHPFFNDFLVANGRLGEVLAIQEREAAASTGPLPDYFLGKSLYCNRQFEGAAQQYRRALEVDPGFIWPHLELGRTLTARGRYEEAIREIQLAGELRRAAGALGYAYGRSGDRRRAESMLRDLERRAAAEYVTPLNFAWIQIGLGRRDAAFASLRRACDTHVPELMRLKVDPVYDPLRSDLRFAELLACIGVS